MTTAVAAKPTPAPVQKVQAEVETSAQTVVAAPVTQPKPAATDESVKERVLALVAEKTGYPIDMLDLDLDLEADLGVDTVKQAEVMATIREAYGIARDDQIKLRDYPDSGSCDPLRKRAASECCCNSRTHPGRSCETCS